MRGSLAERRPGVWSLRLYMGRDEKGRPIQTSHTIVGTKKEAEKEQRRILREVDTGKYAPPSKLTVAQYLERWLEDAVKPSCSTGTYEQTWTRVKKQIIPQLGKLSLEKVTPLQVQAFYTYLLNRKLPSGKRGMAPSTVRLYHSTLSRAFAQAVRWRLITYNPCIEVELPRKIRRTADFLDAAGAQAMLQAIEGEPLYLPVLIAVMTGMRRGEILGLRWRDVDLEAGTVTVVRTLTKTTAGTSFGPPKSDKGRRAIPVPAALVLALRKHKGEQSEHRLRAGVLYKNQDLVIAQQDGRPLTPDRLSENFPALLERKGLPRLRFHDLRHTHASMLLAAGIHPKVVQERLGHATITETMETYSHVMPTLQREASEVLGEQLKKAAREG